MRTSAPLVPVLSAAILAVMLLQLLPAPAAASELSERIRADAQRAADALLRGDYAALIDMTHPRIVAEMGGRDVAIATVARSVADMKADGITLESVTTDAPTEPVSNGALVAVLVRQKKVLRMPEGRYQATGHLLGVSEDGGGTWHFIESSSLTAASIAEYFPPLAGLITLPASTELEKLEDN